MVLAVAENEVHVPVAMQTELVDALEDARAGDIQILPRVAERSPPERFIPMREPDAVFRHARHSLEQVPPTGLSYGFVLDLANGLNCRQ